MQAFSKSTNVFPFVKPGGNDSFLRVNWFMLKDDDISNTRQWPAVHTHNLNACRGLQETAATNCVVWISVMQVSSIAFIPHLDDCTHHTYGPMHGRSNTYFTTHRVMLSNEHNSLEFHPVTCDAHGFLPSSSSTTLTAIPSTFTERITECTYLLTKENHRNLTGDRRLKKVSSSRFPISHEYVSFITHQLSGVGTEGEVTITAKKNKSKQTISHPNLSLESKRLSTIHKTFTASTIAGFNVFRNVMSSNFGVGVKKKAPPLYTEGDRSLNPRR